jgi:hypothetical protein
MFNFSFKTIFQNRYFFKPHVLKPLNQKDPLHSYSCVYIYHSTIILGLVEVFHILTK